jgi:hypothetical protein
MGQKFKDDKIGTLSHSSGTITMTGSSSTYLTIGGQQYQVTSNLSRLISTDVTMAANTRYQIYAVVSGGALALRISANENSVGPAGFTSWKLVGSLMANQAATFASFLNIRGIPSSSLYSDGPLSLTSTGGGAAKGGTIVRDILLTQRIGNMVFHRMEYRQSTAGTAGSGFYVINLPFDIDSQVSTSTDVTANYTAPAGVQASAWGEGTITDSTSRGHMWFRPYDTNSFTAETEVAFTGANLWGPSGSYAMNNANYTFAGTITYPVQGWSNTPIEDL